MALRISLHCWDSVAPLAHDASAINSQNLFLSVSTGSASDDLVIDSAWIATECRVLNSLMHPSVEEKRPPPGTSGMEAQAAAWRSGAG